MGKVHDNIIAADDQGFARLSAALQRGELVAFPTETVYGLGADATKASACASIYEAKGRPSFNPLIVHFPSAREAAKRVVFDGRAEKLATAFWPGPLTLVLPRRVDCDIALLCSAGLSTLAVRVPAHPLAQRLLQDCGLPLAAPSANASGKISPTCAEHVARSLGDRVPYILEGDDACQAGLESTVLDLSGDEATLLRPGTITREEIEAVIGPIAVGKSLMESAGEAMPSPGMLHSHYAPALPLRLNAADVAAGEGLIAFGPTPLPGAAKTINLSEDGDLREAAANLFAALHELDATPGLTGLAAMPIPNEGLGLAINDRLRRAAAPR